MADILGAIGSMNIFGIILYLYIIAFKLKIKMRKRYMIYYALVWSIAYTAFLIVLLKLAGDIELGTNQIGFIALNGISYFLAFVVIDFVVFIICLFLYRKVPYIKNMLGVEKEQSEEIKQKHKTKDKK